MLILRKAFAYHSLSYFIVEELVLVGKNDYDCTRRTFAKQCWYLYCILEWTTRTVQRATIPFIDVHVGCRVSAFIDTRRMSDVLLSSPADSATAFCIDGIRDLGYFRSI